MYLHEEFRVHKLGSDYPSSQDVYLMGMHSETLVIGFVVQKQTYVEV